LYPDLFKDQKAFINWKIKSNQLAKNGFDISVSSLIEEKCTVSQREHGLDIADFFIQNRKSISSNSEVYNRLNTKNPVLKQLVNTFDLIIPYN